MLFSAFEQLTLLTLLSLVELALLSRPNARPESDLALPTQYDYIGCSPTSARILATQDPIE
jgi:hypothetical protein